MDCVQCDGNDIFAVVKVMKDAIKRAREDQRPTFIEGLTYRIGDHTTADDARRYRDQKELEEWKAKDPIVRLGKYLRKKKLWDDKKEAAIQERAKAEVSAVVERAEHIAAPVRTDMFDSMYAELPDELRVQRDTMRTSSLGQDPSQVAQAESSSR
jgi:TPP-dependent pyruvate/acetoin dehydrogenase alpha subunit